MTVSIKLYQPPVAGSEFATYVPQLRQLINDAFDSQDRSCYGEENIFPGVVIPDDELLRVNYGTQGLVAVAFDAEESLSGASNLSPVAMVGIKPWKGKDVDMWKTFLDGKSRDADKFEFYKAKPADTITNSSFDWGLSWAVSKPDPRYRGQGFVAKCMAVLEQHLMNARNQAVGSSVAGADRPIVIWLTTLGGIGNVEYYQRRGFWLQDLDDAPTGMWGSTAPFKVATMKKVI